MSSFGDRFKELRKEKKITQKDLGEMFNLSKSSISRYEKNQQFPDKETLSKLAEYFDVSIDYLMANSDNRNSDAQLKYSDEFEPTLNSKDKRDIEKVFNETLGFLESQNDLMLNGELVDKEDFEALAQSIRSSLEFAKVMSKKKFTPNKYRNNK